MYVLDRRWVTDNMGVWYYASNTARTDGHARTIASVVSEITKHGVNMEKPMNIKNDDIIVTPNMEEPMNIENDDIMVMSGSSYILLEGENDMCMCTGKHNHDRWGQSSTIQVHRSTSWLCGWCCDTQEYYTIRVYSQLCDITVAWFWMWKRPSTTRWPKYSLLFEVYAGVDFVCVYRLNKRGCLNTSKATTLGWGNILAYLVHWGWYVYISLSASVL